jgi:hypothetical protein
VRPLAAPTQKWRSTPAITLTRADNGLGEGYKEEGRDERKGDVMSLHHFVVHRAVPRGGQQQPHFPKSWVKVLQTDDELHEAITHAIEFERDVLARTSARVSHYEALGGLGNLLPLRVEAPSSDPALETHSEAV